VAVKIMEQLINDLKVKIIETLNLEGVAPDDIDEDSQLVGGELDIDSIDVLELVLMMEKDYSVIVNNKELGAEVFSSLRAMANYISEKAPAMSTDNV